MTRNRFVNRERGIDSSKNAGSRGRMLNTPNTLYILRPYSRRRVVHEACLARSSSCATFAIRAPCPVASLRCALVIQLVSSANCGKMHVDYAYKRSPRISPFNLIESILGKTLFHNVDNAFSLCIFYITAHICVQKKILFPAIRIFFYWNSNGMYYQMLFVSWKNVKKSDNS